MFLRETYTNVRTIVELYKHIQLIFEKLILNWYNVLTFIRDAPEPTGEEGEEADMELPKVYEPVWDIKELQERLDMFLSQFNEMVRGSGMDLVFFPDAMLHLVKVCDYEFLTWNNLTLAHIMLETLSINKGKCF